MVLRDPAAIESYHGRGTMVATLRVVFSVMQDFAYLRHFGRATGYVLEFSARVGEERVVGVDVIEFRPRRQDHGLHGHHAPASTVLTLGAEAAKRLAAG